MVLSYHPNVSWSELQQEEHSGWRSEWLEIIILWISLQKIGYTKIKILIPFFINYSFKLGVVTLIFNHWWKLIWYLHKGIPYVLPWCYLTLLLVYKRQSRLLTYAYVAHHGYMDVTDLKRTNKGPWCVSGLSDMQL